MRELLLVLWERDREYRDAFCDYLRGRTELHWRVRGAGTREELEELLAKEKPALLLLAEEDRPLVAEDAADCILCLSEENHGEDEPYLFRYRPMERQLRALLHHMGGSGREGREAPARRARITGVFSPVGGSGVTTLALLIGQQLAQEGRTLYLNLERRAGFDRLLSREKEGSLSDLLYYTRVGEKPSARLEELTESFGALGVIFPAEQSADLRDMNEEDWQLLIRDLAENGRLQELVLDIGDGPRQEEWLLALCDRIYMPVRTDGISAAKELKWRECFTEKEDCPWRDRLHRVLLPPAEAGEDLSDFGGQRFGARGRFVRELLREEEA